MIRSLGVTNLDADRLYAACALGTGVATNQVTNHHGSADPKSTI